LCSSGQVSMLIASQELVVYDFQGNGITGFEFPSKVGMCWRHHQNKSRATIEPAMHRHLINMERLILSLLK